MEKLQTEKNEKMKEEAIGEFLWRAPVTRKLQCL